MLQTEVYLDGEKLKRTRVLKGMTQRGLAKRAGVAASTITLLEGRKRNERFHPPTLAKLAEALEVETSELVGD
jgi:transcriptional regulator with XRE-family HTH domain